MRAAASLGLGLVLVASSATSANRAHADERDVVAARLHVDAPGSCASEDAFWRATARRTERLRRVDAGGDVALDVVMRPSERGASGDVRITRGGRTFAQRKVTGASCDEVTQALSLVVALAFDPAARVDLPPEPAHDDAPPAPAPAPATAAAAPAPAIIAPLAAPRPAERPDVDRAPHPRWRFGIAGHATALGVAAPGATLGYGGFVDLERDAAGLSPSFRAGLLRSDGSVASSSPGIGADITWTLARASVCPFRVDLVRSVSLRPCAGVDAGSMAAHPTGLAAGRDRARPWVAASAAVRLAWSPVRAAFVEAEAGAAAPFVRDELAVDPTVSLYRAPSLVGAAQFAAGVRFP